MCLKNRNSSYYFSLTSSLAPSKFCVSIYGGFLSFIYSNILFSPFINSILCSKSSGTVWLQNKVAVPPCVMYCGAINWTFMCSASVVSGNRGTYHVSIYYLVILTIDVRNVELNIITRLRWQELWSVTIFICLFNSCFFIDNNANIYQKTKSLNIFLYFVHT